jgi:hypothetical protein
MIKVEHDHIQRIGDRSVQGDLPFQTLLGGVHLHGQIVVGDLVRSLGRGEHAP